MKIQNYKIDSFCLNFNNSTPAILIYGQDYGLKDERASLIINNYLGQSKNIIDFDGKSIISNPEILEIELNSISLLSEKKVIRIRDANDKVSTIIENNILENNEECLLILISENLSPRSKLRIMFESNKDTVILPCYSDDKKNVLSIIDQMFKKNDIKIDALGKELLSEYLGADRLITRMEIEKAILYAGKKKELDLKNITSFLSDQTSINIDELYDLILMGKVKKAYRMLIKLQNEGVQAIQILRSFTRQLQNLYFIKDSLVTNKDLNYVIESFKPPIYFKRKENIKLHAYEWTASMINKALILIENAEISCKSPKSNPEYITKQTILSLAFLIKN